MNKLFHWTPLLTVTASRVIVTSENRWCRTCLTFVKVMIGVLGRCGVNVFAKWVVCCQLLSMRSNGHVRSHDCYRRHEKPSFQDTRVQLSSPYGPKLHGVLSVHLSCSEISSTTEFHWNLCRHHLFCGFLKHVGQSRHL